MSLSFEERRFVLRLEDVYLMVDDGGSERMHIHIDVLGGDLLLVRLERAGQGTVIADACAGLIPPLAGSVYFLGRDWAGQPTDMANALRGRIGRVFRSGNWIDYMSMEENILLQLAYHTRRRIRELRIEAAQLARRLGFPGLPRSAPESLNRSDLQVAACVRAFLGHPSLVILEDPTVGADPGLLPKLINVIGACRSQGAAVIWLTLENSIWQDHTLPVSRRLRVTGQEINEVSR